MNNHGSVAQSGQSTGLLLKETKVSLKVNLPLKEQGFLEGQPSFKRARFPLKRDKEGSRCREFESRRGHYMKFNPKLEAEVARFREYVVLVEGKKDVLLLNKLGFHKVFDIHVSGVSLMERIEQIKDMIEKRDRVCILTDFDKNGKKLYFEIKAICTEFGMHLDSKLRGLLLVGGLNHIEQLSEFMKKADQEIKHNRKHWERR